MHRSGIPTATLLILAALLLALLAPVACTEAALTPTPALTPRAAPSWTPQQAIAMIERAPFSTGDSAWNAEFDRYRGRWNVTLVYSVRKVYLPGKERRTLLWHVYEDTGVVEGPFQ